MKCGCQPPEGALALRPAGGWGGEGFCGVLPALLPTAPDPDPSTCLPSLGTLRGWVWLVPPPRPQRSIWNPQRLWARFIMNNRRGSAASLVSELRQVLPSRGPGTPTGSTDSQTCLQPVPYHLSDPGQAPTPQSFAFLGLQCLGEQRGLPTRGASLAGSAGQGQERALQAGSPGQHAR